MKSEQSRPAMLTVICLVWGDDPTATINSVTERNDKIRGGKELLAFVDSGALDNVLPKSVCTEYTLGGDFPQSTQNTSNKDCGNYALNRDCVKVMLLFLERPI